MLPDGILLLSHTFLQPPDPLGQGLQLLQGNSSMFTMRNTLRQRPVQQPYSSPVG
jgi:hypothetical protein